MDEFELKIEDIIGKIENVEPLLTEIGEYFIERTRQRFDSGGPAGQKWKAVSQYTLDRKSKLGNLGANVFTSKLRESISYRIENSQLIFFTDVDYAEYVEAARPVFDPDDADGSAIDEILANYLQ